MKDRQDILEQHVMKGWDLPEEKRVIPSKTDTSSMGTTFLRSSTAKGVTEAVSVATLNLDLGEQGLQSQLKIGATASQLTLLAPKVVARRIFLY
jgi:hypothetical protein